MKSQSKEDSEEQDKDSYLTDEESEIINKSFDKKMDTRQSIRKTLKDI